MFAALKVHHGGFLQSQHEELEAMTGVPDIQKDIMMSDMERANGGANGNYNEKTETA